MCGIVAYIGGKEALPILIKGLRKLEYRGYDSSGVAILDGNLKIFKEPGRILNLERNLDDSRSKIGIGHTRWATHGIPNKTNAHPHSSHSGRFAIVHNGTVDNYIEIQSNYLSTIDLKSDTDTEVLASLFDILYIDDIHNAFKRFIEIVRGSYALVILDRDNVDTLYVIKNRSPLLVGIGKEESYIASDVGAMIEYTNEFYDLSDQEYGIIKKDSISIFDRNNNELHKEKYIAKKNMIDSSLGIYSHYMLKEIEEQPSVIRRLISNFRISNELLIILNQAKKYYIVASGTSYNAGLVSKYIFENITNKPVEVFIGSEFNYFTPILEKNAFFIFLSQSGETADSRRALEKVKSLGYKALSITNVETSSLARETDFTLNLIAGVETAVASTKAYTAQITMMTLIANEISPSNFNASYELSVVASVMDEIIFRKHEIEQLVLQKIAHSRNCFYIGRGVDFYLAIEAALKLKEVSYIQAEGFAAAELKHGTIALIEKNTPVIALISHPNSQLTRGNISEVKAREASTIVISLEKVSNVTDDFIISNVHQLLASLVEILPTQYMAFYAALHRGCDIDKPRNLAKAVTVE